jgi:hypothetical protein
MRKLIYLSMLSMLVFAQEADTSAAKYGWTKELTTSLNLTQSTFSNWSKGGDNALAWQFNIDGKFVNDQEVSNTEFKTILRYGENKIANAKSQKTIDEFRADAIYTYKFGTSVNPYASLGLLTQMTEGTDAETGITNSNFFDPGYITAAIGAGYQPIEQVKIRAGAAGKYTYTDKYPVPYADDPETSEIEKTMFEPGLQGVIDLNWKINETTSFKSYVESFYNFGMAKETDVIWDNTLTSKVSDYINFNLTANLIYDFDVSSKRQLAQALSIGFSFSVF